MLRPLGTILLARVFGTGVAADLAARGAVYLADEARTALDRPDQRLARVRLRPGETYTVIARPPATRAERRLAARQRALRARERKVGRPTRRQLKAARRLERAQRRLDRVGPDSRRAARRARTEHARGATFDRVMRPTRRQAKVRAELDAVTAELDAARHVSFERARVRGRGRRRSADRRSSRVRVFD